MRLGHGTGVSDSISRRRERNGCMVNGREKAIVSNGLRWQREERKNGWESRLSATKREPGFATGQTTQEMH